MRFIMFFFVFSSSWAQGAVEILNTEISEMSIQEKLLHRKLLNSIQNAQVAVAFNDKMDEHQDQEAGPKPELLVHLIAKKRVQK